MKLIYGSTALKQWFPDYDMKPKDLDIISDEMYYQNMKEIDCHWTNAFNYLKNNKNATFVDPDLLYTIKVSHAKYNINWEKTIKHIMFMKSKGCKLDKTFYDLLINDWKNIHKRPKVNLSGPNDKFFKSNIKRKYDHDDLHYHFSFYEKPLNERIRYDLHKPQCSEKLFTLLSKDDKIKCGLEEIYVLAFERYIINGIPVKHSIIKTLKQMITSSTSGWFNLFLIENFDKLRKYDLTYYNNKIMEIQNETL